MKKILALLTTLFLFVSAWAPAASAGETDPAVAVAEAAVIGISEVSEAYATAHADETMTREELAAKAASLRQESGLYKTTAKMLKTMEESPSVKYLGEEKRLSGVYSVTEYKYPARDERRHAVLAIKAVVTDAKLEFINLRLARSEACGTGSSRCSATAAPLALQESVRAKDAYARALNTIKFAVP